MADLVVEAPPLPVIDFIQMSIGVIGDSSVGKTSLVLTQGQFCQQSKSTLETVDYQSTTIDYQGSKYKIQFADTNGSERYDSVIWQPFRKVNAVMICYDTTKMDSFKRLDHWLKECRKHVQPDVKILVVGLKAENEKNREVSKSEGKRWASLEDYAWVEGSSRDGTFSLPSIMALLKDKKVAAESTRPKNYRQYLDLNNVAGNNEAKEALEKFLLQFEAPNLFKDNEGDLSGSMLMYGPTGCGKTFLVKEAARTCGMEYIEVQPSLVSDNQGESERKVKDLFKQARLKAPCIFFMDELDAFCPNRDEIGKRSLDGKTVNQILLCIDECKSQPIFVVAATNRPQAIDPAFARRMSTQIYVRLIDRTGRMKVLSTQLKNFSHSQLKDLVDISAGLSGADIDTALKSARTTLRQRLIKATHVVQCDNHFYPCDVSDPGAIPRTDHHLGSLPPLPFELVSHSLRYCHKSVSQQDIKKYDEYYDSKSM